jgi:nitrogen fixation NifU-like protein
MRLYIKVENDIITEAKFKTFGCGAAIATSSMVTDLVKGKSIDEALTVSNAAVAEALGGLPKVKMHCSVLAEEALKSALALYKKGHAVPVKISADAGHEHEWSNSCGLECGLKETNRHLRREIPERNVNMTLRKSSPMKFPTGGLCIGLFQDFE